MAEEEQGKDCNHPSMSSDEAASAEPAHDDHDDDEEGSSCRRRPYYECTFCRRGFSNAQALGGHMNIHRKDRARPLLPVALPLPATTDKKKTPASQQKPHELSLFGADLRLGQGGGQVGGSVVVAGGGRREEEGGGGALDLELRLGHRP